MKRGSVRASKRERVEPHFYEYTRSFSGERSRPTWLNCFFDVLGYKSIIKNNPISEVISIVKEIQDTLDKHNMSKKLTNFDMFSQLFDAILRPRLLLQPVERCRTGGLQSDLILSIRNNRAIDGLPVCRGEVCIGL